MQPSSSDALRVQLAPANPLETALVDQIICASEELDRLRRNRPDQPDATWLRLFSLAQSLFHRALADLNRHRQSSPSHALPPQPAQPSTPPPSSLPPFPERLANFLDQLKHPEPPATRSAQTSDPADSPSTTIQPINRRDRRRLAALMRASPERRQRMIASSAVQG